MSALDEFRSFKGLWRGGFKTGYDSIRNQKLIEDYLKDNIGNNVTILEIGCGGGQWTKFLSELSGIRKIIAIDLFSEEYHQFWQTVGLEKKGLVEYHTIQDFSLSMIEDNNIDFVFSYDTFSYISPAGQEVYLSNLFKKCKNNAKLLINYADVDKYVKYNLKSFYRFQLQHIGKVEVLEKTPLDRILHCAKKSVNGSPAQGKLYWIGVNRFVELCNKNNFTVLNNDLDIDKSSGLTLFQKTVQEVSEPVEEVSESVEEVSEPVQEVSEPVEEVSESVEEVSESVQEVSESVQEVSEPVEEVSEPVEEVSESVEEVSEPVQEVSEPVEEVSESVQEVSESVEEEQEGYFDA